MKYASFLAKGQGNGVVISDGSGDPNSLHDFNMIWIQEFKKSHAYEVWERVTDPVLFDIVETKQQVSSQKEEIDFEENVIVEKQVQRRKEKGKKRAYSEYIQSVVSL